MMRVSQFNNSSMFQVSQRQNNVRGASNQDFRTSLQNNMQSAQGMTAGNNQPQMIAGQQNSIQPTAPEGFSGFSGAANMPMMPDGNMPEMPAMPDGETPPAMPDGETPPAMPDGETPPAMPDGETPPEKPEGTEGIDGGMQSPEDLPEIPAGEEPPAKPNESDGGMSQPPSGMPGGFSGMNSMNRPGGSFSGMGGIGSFNAARFAMNIR